MGIGPKNLGLRHPGFGLLLLFLVQSFYIQLWPTFHPANESIRFYFVESLVRDGTLSVDPALERYGVPNKDVSIHDGRAYMDKAPGVAFAVAPLYVALRTVGFDSLPWEMRWFLLTLLGLTIPNLLATTLFFRLGRDLSGGRDDVALGLAAAYAVATPALLYSTLFFGHQFAAILFLAGFYLLRPATVVSSGAAFTAGFLISFAVASEYQAVLAAAGLAVYGMVRAVDWRGRAMLVLGGLVPAAIVLGYHWLSFGGPLNFPYAYKGAEELAEMHAQGLFGFVWPYWEGGHGQLLSARRGLIYSAPITALWPLGIIRMWRAPGWRAARYAVLFVGLAHTILLTGYLYWTGGYCHGPRFLVPVLPFMVLPLAALWRPPGEGETPRAISSVVRTWLFPGLALVGALLHLAVLMSFPYPREEIQAPFYELTFPLLLQGCTAPNVLGLSSGPAMLVFALLVGGAALWLFTRLRAGASRPIAGRLLVAVAVALAIILAQLLVAPPPDSPAARRWQNEARELMQCSPIAARLVPISATNNQLSAQVLSK